MRLPWSQYSGIFHHFLYYRIMTNQIAYARAVVVHANFAQLAPRQDISYSQVESRMLLWCKAGTGTVTVNGRKVAFDAGQLLWIPWRHAIRYKASEDDPFLLGGVHLIPHHASRRSVTFEVAHDPQHRLAGARWRQDCQLAGIPEFRLRRLAPAEPLSHLLEYVVGVFLCGPPPSWLARQLAGLILHEMAAVERAAPPPEGPPELERMKQFIEFHPSRPLSLRDLSEFARLSPATVCRLFRTHMNTTPVTWIGRVKMDRARTLLRTHRHSIAEVGVAVGIADPYYFSKCFKKATGQSPQAYRRTAHWL